MGNTVFFNPKGWWKNNIYFVFLYYSFLLFFHNIIGLEEYGFGAEYVAIYYEKCLKKWI